MQKRLLVIDDDAVVLESCRRIFEAQGFHVAAAGNPRDGLELAAGSRFDVILCDWKMPDLDGRDAVEILDKRCPDAAIVMISGYPSTERAADAMKSGALDYVAKPFTPEEILGTVQRAMNRRAQAGARSAEALEKAVKSISFPMPSMDDQTPQTIAETVANKLGVGKTTSPWVSVFVLGILGGAYVGFGGMLASTTTFDLAPKMGMGFARFMSGAVFSLGLILVVIAGAELFTGNNLMLSSAMAGKIRFRTMLERWGLVYSTNFIGSMLLVCLFVFGGVWKLSDGALGSYAVQVAYAKVSLGFLEALLRAIGCNWLVCLAVWMALAARQTIGKIFAIFFPVMGFVALGLEHSVANMYFIPAGLLLRSVTGLPAPEGVSPEALSWLSFVWKNLVPVTIGNIIGGGVFVGMGYWGAYLRNAKE